MAPRSQGPRELFPRSLPKSSDDVFTTAATVPSFEGSMRLRAEAEALTLPREELMSKFPLKSLRRPDILPLSVNSAPLAILAGSLALTPSLFSAASRPFVLKRTSSRVASIRMFWVSGMPLQVPLMVPDAPLSGVVNTKSLMRKLLTGPLKRPLLMSAVNSLP